MKTKTSVVCSIANKLARIGVKNPMKAAWQLHRAIIMMIDAIDFGYHALAVSIARQINEKLFKLGMLASELLPPVVSRLVVSF